MAISVAQLVLEITISWHHSNPIVLSLHNNGWMPALQSPNHMPSWQCNVRKNNDKKKHRATTLMGVMETATA